MSNRKDSSTHKCKSKIPLASILNAVKLFVNVPIRRTPTGWKFSLLSREFFGCVFVYLSIVPIYWAVLSDIYPLFLEPGEFQDPTDFLNQQIYYELCVIFMVPYIITPVTSWLDAPALAAYINRCIRFQDLFEETVGKRLQLFLRTKPLMTFCVCSLIIQNTAAQVMPPYLAFWKTPACSINMMVLCCYLVYWLTLTDCLGQAGQAVADCLKLELQSKHCDSKKIVRYKQLWLELSQLTTESSLHSYRTLSVPFLLSLATITISVYGLIANIREPLYVAFYTMCSVFNTLPLLYYCDYACTTTVKVRDPTMNLLSNVRRSQVKVLCWEAVSSFLETIAESPPVISIGGFAVVDRKFLHAAGATISTYLVVIFQFRMSIKTTDEKTVDGMCGAEPTVYTASE